MWVRLGGAESIGQSRATDLEFKSVVRSRAELRVELPSRMTLQCGKSGLFGDWMGIANWSGIGVASSRSRLSRLESTGIGCVAESQGGLGARRCEEGSPRRVFKSKRVVFAISGARIVVITSVSLFLFNYCTCFPCGTLFPQDSAQREELVQSCVSSSGQHNACKPGFAFHGRVPSHNGSSA